MFNDSTPTATHRMICKYPYHNFIWKLRSYILISSYKTFFRNIVSNIDIFFPRSNWCGQSLIEDFGVDSSKVNGGTVCFDLDTWSADWTLDREKNPTLLFVGNDFQRKGGNFLLKLFLELTDKITLKIISNDPCLDSQKLPQRVKHLKNISRKKILKHYQQDNIFIFPTYKEHLGLSQIEALAAGLPLISRDVGGVSDAVINGHNGFLIPYESTDQEWIEKIQYLIDHPEERERMGKNSRKLAEKKFSIENFKKTIHDTILKLLEEYALK
jgi:glycosyltransferase involved in cell wall biosynthesis